MRRLSFALAALAVAISAACSNDSTFGGGGTPCPALAIAPPVLLYPKPGATAVPATVGSVILANIGPLGGSVILTTTGSAVGAGAFGAAPSPLPNGAATPPAGTTAQTASIPTLFAGSTYTVNFTANAAAGSSCSPPQTGGALGTFST
jgi:hypothetical protein